MPPTRVPTTGAPQANDSVTTFGQPSRSLARKLTSAALKPCRQLFIRTFAKQLDAILQAQLRCETFQFDAECSFAKNIEPQPSMLSLDYLDRANQKFVALPRDQGANG